MNRLRALSQPYWDMLLWFVLGVAIVALSVAASAHIWPSAQI